jgi:hypothetical protein
LCLSSPASQPARRLPSLWSSAFDAPEAR